MDYRPNADGVRWFVRNVWPGLKSRLPALTFAIVGRDPLPAVQRLADSPGVTVTGSVPDVRPYLAAGSVAICPLRIARGVQNKILEAMAMGKAVVASPAGIEGLDVEVGKHLLAADSPEQWQKTILELLDNEERRNMLGRAGRQHVQSRYTWAARMKPLVTLCERLCGQQASADGHVVSPEVRHGAGCR